MAKVEEFDDEAFRDTVTHIDKDGKRVFFHPKKPSGKLYNWRKYLSYVFLIALFGLPFVKINDDPIFLFNVIERKFILFGVRFWPQDFFIFVMGMLIFILFIALFTVVYGRVFCGWVCPQTIFMEMVFRRIEYWIDGDAAEQRALKKAPLSWSKLGKRFLKLSIFFIIAVIAANTFLAYIIGIDELKHIMTGKFSEHVGGFLAMIIFSGVFFFIFHWFREQVCLVVCPYGRMQGVLLDKHSIVVAYDHKRGEPRKKYSKIPEPGAGDCIDCNECVRVCPTGIDIRNGTQLECTNCTACIDACDHIMEKVNKPKGLIRYASEYTIRTGRKLKWTYRMVAYTGVLVVLIGIESFLLVTRTDIDVSVNRARGQIFTKMDDGRIGNLYSIKVVNKIREDLPITFKVMDAEVQMIGKQMVVPAGNLKDGEFFVIIPEEDLKKRKTDLILELYNGDKLVHKEPIIFIGPSNNKSH